MQARVWDLMGDVEEPGECLHTLGWDSGAVNQVSKVEPPLDSWWHTPPLAYLCASTRSGETAAR